MTLAFTGNDDLGYSFWAGQRSKHEVYSMSDDVFIFPLSNESIDRRIGVDLD